MVLGDLEGGQFDEGFRGEREMDGGERRREMTVVGVRVFEEEELRVAGSTLVEGGDEGGGGDDGTP